MVCATMASNESDFDLRFVFPAGGRILRKRTRGGEQCESEQGGGESGLFHFHGFAAVDESWSRIS